MWIKDFDGSLSETDPNVLLKNNKIKLRRNHFCWWLILGMCRLKVKVVPYMQILPYKQVDDLRRPESVMKVFAIKACDAKVSQ